MTREKRILEELNRAEQRLKHVLECGVDDKEVDEALAYINGMKKMLTLLGYRAIEDETKSEFVKEYWIFTYTAIEDVR